MMMVKGKARIDGCDCGGKCDERGVDQFNEKCSVKMCVGNRWGDAKEERGGRGVD